VLLAGYLTAHAFDDFAPTLTQIGHIYGITRRGFGASSHPAGGYTSQRLADDILRALDELQLTKPVLMGHSFGGQDQTILAENHSDRIAALVYLNSAEDPTDTNYGVQPPSPEKLPAAARERPKPDLSSFQAYRAWQQKTFDIQLPEAELRQLYASNPDGSMGKFLFGTVRGLMFNGLEKPDFAKIKVPVLAFVAEPMSLEDRIKKYKPQNDSERSALEQQYKYDSAIRDHRLDALNKGVPATEIVSVSNANFYIFLSNGPDIVRAVTPFIKKLN
jgi:pimeloyl-ACP methyl ester carboxylesterase